MMSPSLTSDANAKIVFAGLVLQQLQRLRVSLGVKFELVPIFVDDAETALGAGKSASTRIDESGSTLTFVERRTLVVNYERLLPEVIVVDGKSVSSLLERFHRGELVS
jgi:hypothetical protein